MSKPRTATLRVAHKASCEHATKTSLESLDDCTCKPAYYTFHRDKLGNPVKGPRVGDRQIADRALRKVLVELDENRAEVGPRRRKTMTFDEWATAYLVNIEEDRGVKRSTHESISAITKAGRWRQSIQSSCVLCPPTTWTRCSR